MLTRRRADRSDAAVDAALRRLSERCAAADGQAPFNEASLLEVDQVEWFEHDGALIGAAMLGGDTELAVDPGHRGRGFGREILAAVVAPGAGVWAHGDHPAARALAAERGMVRERVLLQLRARLDDAATRTVAALPEGVTVDGFREGVDEDAWVALNARTFATHPEQGRITRETLLPRLAENGSANFLIARDEDGSMVGYCWLKLADDGLGEIYVLGVDPGRAGRGLGRALLAAGLARLRELGIEESALYVEADNEPALRLYRSFGYRDHTIDVLYRMPNPDSSR